jgi:hypothetical protein
LVDSVLHPPLPSSWTMSRRVIIPPIVLLPPTHQH